MGESIAFLVASVSGNYAGGKLAELIAGKPTPYAPDTSIPGVTSATIKKGNKSHPPEKVPQVDISKSLQMFQQAAQEQVSSYEKGLTYYNSALLAAGQSIKQGYANANATLKPVSFASTQALNEQLKMMGMDPLPATQSISTQLANVGYFPDLSKKIDEANKLKDPDQRALAKQDILSNLEDLQKNYSPTSALAFAGPWPEKDYQAQLDWQNKLAQGQQIMTSARQSIQDISTQFKNDYAPNYETGYTGQEITNKIVSTPGYEFQMNQGTNAIIRQASALGTIASGNTLGAITNYGQGLAQNYYGIYMNNLANIAQQGSYATGQIAGNQVQEGKDYGSLIEAGGKAGMLTYQMMGDAKAQSLYAQGNLFADAAKFNTGIQYDAIEKGMQREAEAKEAAANRQAGLQQQAISSQAAMTNASTARQAFNYSVFQGQQGGAQYFGSQAPLSPYTGSNYGYNSNYRIV